MGGVSARRDPWPDRPRDRWLPAGPRPRTVGRSFFPGLGRSLFGLRYVPRAFRGVDPSPRIERGKGQRVHRLVVRGMPHDSDGEQPAAIGELPLRENAARVRPEHVTPGQLTGQRTSARRRHEFADPTPRVTDRAHRGLVRTPLVRGLSQANDLQDAAPAHHHTEGLPPRAARPYPADVPRKAGSEQRLARSTVGSGRDSQPMGQAAGELEFASLPGQSPGRIRRSRNHPDGQEEDDASFDRRYAWVSVPLAGRLSMRHRCATGEVVPVRTSIVRSRAADAALPAEPDRTAGSSGGQPSGTSVGRTVRAPGTP
jgi:hypothetical protein